jgi:predicted dehydrogenase
MSTQRAEMATHEPVTLVVVGAGQRGATYARLAVRQGARVVAIADPDRERLAGLADELGVAHEARFEGWQALTAAGRLASAAVVATPDRLHRDPAVELLRQGYDVLLEKPMAPTEADATEIVEVAERHRVSLTVAHVLRYQPVTRAVESFLRPDGIGEVVSIQHLEPVGDYHFTHSYVRGNWRNERESSSVLLAKSCHDIDWLSHIVGSRAVRVSSFGGLYEFRPDRAPDGAGDRCMDCQVEPSCPFSAKRLYLGAVQGDKPWTWPTTVVSDVHTHEALESALWSGPYGRCVYRSDNDVLDHQAVNIEYESGVVASFLLSAFTPMGGRRTRIGGTRGHLEVDDSGLQLYRFIDRSTTSFAVADVAGGGPATDEGHGGGDAGLIKAWVEALETGDWSSVPTDGRASLDSHRIVWAAEEARIGGRVVSLLDA